MLSDIKLVDDLFPLCELRNINTWCKQSPMTYTHGGSNESSLRNTRFAYHFKVESNYFVDTINENVTKPLGLDILELECYDAYINHYDHATPTLIHDDYSFVGKSITVIFFPQMHWQPNWGGELVFYDNKLEATRAISYKPNRCLVFDGSIQHCVKQPSVNANFPRYSITMKFTRKDD